MDTSERAWIDMAKLVELLDFCEGDKRWTPEIGRPQLWLPLPIRPILGGGLAAEYVASGIALSPIVAGQRWDDRPVAAEGGLAAPGEVKFVVPMVGALLPTLGACCTRKGRRVRRPVEGAQVCSRLEPVNVSNMARWDL
ncbi:hypothetical protein [Pseudoduganella sp. OTU4001]|uniref:hypothetical protein n=1 Tax=Pseudoduganella sp. OTU4001 TaxID=3043854 RepID=UPI00313C5BA8